MSKNTATATPTTTADKGIGYMTVPELAQKIGLTKVSVYNRCRFAESDPLYIRNVTLGKRGRLIPNDEAERLIKAANSH